MLRSSCEYWLISPVIKVTLLVEVQHVPVPIGLWLLQLFQYTRIRDRALSASLLTFVLRVAAFQHTVPRAILERPTRTSETSEANIPTYLPFTRQSSA